MLHVVWKGQVIGTLAWPKPTAGQRIVHIYQPRSSIGQPRPPRREIAGRVEAGPGTQLVLHIPTQTPKEDVAALGYWPVFQPNGYFAVSIQGRRLAPRRA